MSPPSLPEWNPDNHLVAILPQNCKHRQMFHLYRRKFHIHKGGTWNMYKSLTHALSHSNWRKICTAEIWCYLHIRCATFAINSYLKKHILLPFHILSSQDVYHLTQHGDRYIRRATFTINSHLKKKTYCCHFTYYIVTGRVLFDPAWWQAQAYFSSRNDQSLTE